jgi:dTDP-4-dehydrorhamnose reductase
MKIGLLGGSGQIGREVLALAAHFQCDVDAPSSEEVDLADQRGVTQWVNAGGFDAVINCAAYTAVDAAETDVERAHRVNGVGAGHVAQACCRVSIPTVFVSTDYVFDGVKSSPYDEDDIPNPQCVYGRSKLEGERATLTANPRSVVLRVSWVFSAQGRNFVRTMVELAADRDELRVVDDQRGSPCGARSIADALLRVTRQVLETGAGYGVYHFANSPYVSWHEFAVEIMSMLRDQDPHVGEVTVRPVATEQYPTPAQRPTNSCLAAHRLATNFGIVQPGWRLELAETIDALRRGSSVKD